MRQTRMTGVLAGLFFAVAAGSAVPAGAAEIRVLSAGAVRAAVVDLAKDFEQDTGHTVRFTFATVGVLQKKIADGETADLFIHQISEILAVKGVTLAGPLPRELQKVSVYSAGVAARASAPEAATRFLAFLQTPSSRAKFKQVGLDYTE